MTGDRIYDHHTVVGAGFDVLFFYGCFGLVQMCGQPGNFFGSNIDHKGAAAVATCCAIYLRGNNSVQFLHKLVNILTILRLEKCSEGPIFGFFCLRCCCNIGK